MKVKKLLPTAILPKKAHAGDLGYDLYAAKTITIPPRSVGLVRTGIAIQFPEGYGGIIKDRSSVATKQNLTTVAGVIDNGYTGEISVAMRSHKNEAGITISAGEKIAQLILIPVTNFEIEEVEDINSFDGRGSGGFGSTGR